MSAEPSAPCLAARHASEPHGHDEAASPPAASGELAQVRADLAADRAHWARRGAGPVRLRRGYHAAVLYRASRYAHERGWRVTAWLLWTVNGWWTGADLPPSSRIGGGLFLPRPHGAILAGTVGQDAAIGFQASIGGLLKDPERDVGGGPGLPRIGDGVVLEPAALVLGAIRVGDRARIGPRCVVLKDVEADAEVLPPEWRARTTAS